MSPSAGLLLFGLTGCGVDWCGRFDISCSVDSQDYSFALDEDRDGDGWSFLLDCDDGDPLVHPFSEEQCNGYDDDCDDAIDEGLPTLPYWPDLDQDGFGGAGQPYVMSCSGPASPTVDNDLDCDDLNPAASPLGLEVCDGADNDCDGWIDVNPLEGGVEAAADVDGDGAIDPSTRALTCPEAPGWSTNPLAAVDCDDTDPTVAPGNLELCDERDNDCDGRDEHTDDLDLSGGLLVAPDRDLDGVGDAATPGWAACAISPGLVMSNGDCDDNASEALPGGVEVCDGLDNDCDGAVDGLTAADAILVYEDLDGDGWGGAAVLACAAEAPLVALGGDCDDFNPAAHPYALGEPCDGSADLNCDGEVGLGDADGDGVIACDDCDDADPATHPGADEQCDTLGVDEDCDGAANADDTDITLAGPHFQDQDGDGFGGEFLAVGCAPAAGVADQGGDCNDADATVFPGAAERCGGAVDSDCDGAVGVCDATVPLLATQAHGLILGEAGDGLGATALALPSGGLYLSAPGAEAGAGLLLRLSAADLSPGQTLARESLAPSVAGDQAGMGLGARLGWAPNGEGGALLLVASPGEDWVTVDAGGLRLYEDPPGASPLATLAGLSGGGGLGSAAWAEPDGAGLWVATPRDRDGDALLGRVDRFVLPMEGRFSPEDAALSLWGEAAGGRLGEQLGGAGDLNGDGLSELYLSCALCLAEADVVGLIFESPVEATTLDAATLRLRSPDRWGPPTIGPLVAGDVDQDGLDDLFLGLPGAATLPGRLGAAQLFLSTGRLAAGPGDLHLREAEAAVFAAGGADELGATVAIEADAPEGPVLWVGAPGAGAIYALSPGLGALSLPAPRFVDPDAGLGATLIVGSDLDGDGAADLLVGGGETIALLFGG
jgi:hypothetical protein